MKKNHSCSFAIAAVLFAGVLSLPAADSQKTISAPGYRPESKGEKAFLGRLETCRIAVLPTVARLRTGNVASGASQKAVVSFLKEKKLGMPELRNTDLDLGKPEGQFQFALFESDLKTIGTAVRKLSGADYYLAIEQLLTPTPSGDLAVGGIHVYVLDSKGENAFSFLLNSHHKILTDAGLRSKDSSEKGREALISKGTSVALAALEQQVEAAQAKK